VTDPTPLPETPAPLSAPPAQSAVDVARAGVRFGARRFGLAALIWALHAVLSLAATFSVYWWAGRTTNRLALPLDYDALPTALWSPLLKGVAPGIGIAVLNLLWIVPLVWGASAALRVGAAYAAAHGGRGVRTGVGQRGWQGVGLSALVGLLTVAWGAAAVVAAALLDALWDGAASLFWSTFALMPVLLFGGWAVLAFAHDHARCAVALGMPVGRSLRIGLSAIGRDGPTVRLGVAALALAWLLWLAVPLADAHADGATRAAFWAAFVAGQLLLLARTWIDVAWIGGVAARHVALRADDGSWLGLRLPRPRRTPPAQ
jgi:hypothetical protein